MPELTIDAGTFRFAYRDAGESDAPPLVFLHGFPFNASLWEPQMQELSSDRRTIAPDFRGFGDSQLMPGPYSMARLADDVAELMDALEIERAIFAGLSMGGYVAFELWRGHPERVAGLVLADTKPDPDSPKARAGRAEMASRARDQGSGVIAAELAPKLVAPATRTGRPEVLEHLRRMMEAAEPEAIVAALEGMADREDSRPLLPDVQTPACVIVGSDDVITPVDQAEEWSSRMPSSTLEVIARAGHVSNLERPAAFNRAIRRFLHSLGSGLAFAALAALCACAGIPEPPSAIPALEAPAVQAPVYEDVSWLVPALEAPAPLPPRITWSPVRPEEGTLVALLIEPAARGIPLLEIDLRATRRGAGGDRRLDPVLAPLEGGRRLAFVAAPIGSTEIELQLTAMLVDGSRLTLRRRVPVERKPYPSTQISVSRRFTQPDRATIERARRERATIRATLAGMTPVLFIDGPFSIPRHDVTTSVFGQRRLFNGQLRSRHTGLDIDGDTGDPIYAANSGRVVLAREFFFNGNAIYIDHGLGLYTSYMHLSDFEVSEGEWVERGQLIGRVGATGRVTGPHLHWGLYMQGTPLDPMSLFDDAFLAASRLVVSAPRPAAVPDMGNGMSPLGQ